MEKRLCFVKIYNQLISYWVIWSVRYKSRLSANVNNELCIEVHAPLGLDLNTIQNFVVTNYAFLKEQIALRANHPFFNLWKKYLLIFGEKHRFTYEVNKTKNTYQIKDQKIFLKLQNDQFLISTLHKVLTRKANQYLPTQTHYWAEKLAVFPNQIQIKKMKGAWGKTNVKTKRISYNFFLIQMPKEVIDYVIIHELCHLWHPNHGTAFWKAVGQYYPQYFTAIQKLKEYY